MCAEPKEIDVGVLCAMFHFVSCNSVTPWCTVLLGELTDAIDRSVLLQFSHYSYLFLHRDSELSLGSDFFHFISPRSHHLFLYSEILFAMPFHHLYPLF
jgi:hypothetical protein